MIARVWHGFTTPEHADAFYRITLEARTAAGPEPEERFSAAVTYHRAVGNEVEFITIILWDSLDDVRAIAGHDYEKGGHP